MPPALVLAGWALPPLHVHWRYLRLWRRISRVSGDLGAGLLERESESPPFHLHWYLPQSPAGVEIDPRTLVAELHLRAVPCERSHTEERPLDVTLHEWSLSTQHCTTIRSKTSYESITFLPEATARPLALLHCTSEGKRSYPSSANLHGQVRSSQALSSGRN